MNLSSARTISFKDGETLVDAQVRYQRDQWQITLHGETTLARGKKLEGDRFAVELDDRRLIAIATFFIILGHDGRRVAQLLVLFLPAVLWMVWPVRTAGMRQLRRVAAVLRSAGAWPTAPCARPG